MNAETVLIAIVMFLALIGMIICSKKQKASPAAQPIAIGLLVVVVVCGVLMLYKTGIFGDNNDFMEIENRYYASQGQVVGEYVNKNFAGKKVLVIMDRGYEKNPRTEVLLQALKAGAGSDLDVTADTLTLANAPKGPEGEEFEMPLFETMTAKDFNAVLSKHKDAGVIISTIGLPRDAKNMTLWRQKDRPKLILLSASDMRGYDALIKTDMIAAIVVVGPNAKFTEDAPPKDVQKTFDLRYVLIDSKNVEEYGNMFK
ncbi:MAG: hypothetical protein PHS31_02675 [Victivallaceae bacterium]|nr:hypothetical protein [Victivallaceae bacterium]MDD4181013.1 hypothetical protein [Victivallaceae bacterium]